MTQGGTCTFQGQELQQDWALVADMLPQGWQDKAKELGALQRTRGFKDASTLLRIMFIHLAQGQALRETAVQAKLAGLADVSDVAILKRLNACGAWFEWMANGLATGRRRPAPDHVATSFAAPRALRRHLRAPEIHSSPDRARPW